MAVTFAKILDFQQKLNISGEYHHYHDLMRSSDTINIDDPDNDISGTDPLEEKLLSDAKGDSSVK